MKRIKNLKNNPWAKFEGRIWLGYVLNKYDIYFALSIYKLRLNTSFSWYSKMRKCVCPSVVLNWFFIQETKFDKDIGHLMVTRSKKLSKVFWLFNKPQAV